MTEGATFIFSIISAVMDRL